MVWPDPLRGNDGQLVSSSRAWRDERRPQLISTFEDWVYGPVPAPPTTLDVRTTTGPRPALGGTAVLQEMHVVTTGPDTTFSLLVVTPVGSPRPAPVFLGANFFGNHRVLDDPAIAVSHSPVGAHGHPPHEDERGAESAAWDVDRTISAGYAFATFCMSEVVPDHAELARPALAGFAGGRGRTGAISAWAWAFARSLDVLATLPQLDPVRVVAVGHSRLGKAALWAAAVDERFAAVIPSQSGCGGAAPSRTAPELAVPGPDGRPVAETVEQITTRFPHWFATAFADLADRVDDIAVEQHELVALCAPRPVLLPNAVEDLWADPDGQFEVLRGADPVYRLLGASGLETEDRPGVGESSLGRLGYSLRQGGHAMLAEDWPVWRAFTDRWLPA